MTRFVLALAACVPCVALGADDPKMPDPKPPATELEGVWQEPLRPGEDPAVRFKITFAGDKVTIKGRCTGFLVTDVTLADCVPDKK